MWIVFTKKFTKSHLSWGKKHQTYSVIFLLKYVGDCSHEIRRQLLLGRKAMTNLDSILKSKHINQFADKGPCSQSCGLSSSHVRIWELDCEKGWVLKNWCFLIVVLEKTHESPLDRKEINPVNPEGNQPWIFTGKTDAQTEAPILWPPDAKSRLIGKDWCWERLNAKGEEGGRGWGG